MSLTINKYRKALFSIPSIPSILIAAAVALSAPTVNASPDILPGLWKFQVSMKSDSGAIEAAMAQAQAVLEAMPPEQRAMMETMMKNSGVGKLNLKNRSFETCLTEKEIANFELPKPHQQCQQTLEQQGLGLYTMKLSCKDNPPVKGSGELKVVNQKEMLGQMDLTTQMSGRQENIQFKQHASWVKSDCQ